MSVNNTEMVDALNQAIERRDRPRFERLIQEGCPFDIPGSDGRYPMHVAAKNAQTGFIFDVLEHTPLDINLPDANGDTVLHHLAAGFHHESCDHLITKYHACADATNHAGHTPFESAQFGGDGETLLSQRRLTMEKLLPAMKNPEAFARCELAFKMRIGRQSDDKKVVFGFSPIGDERLFTRPTLLCLGGNAATHEMNAADAARLGKRMIGRVGVEADDLTVLGAVYPFSKDENSDNRQLINMNAVRGVPHNYYIPAYLFVRDHLKPLLVDDASGTRLPMGQAMRHMRNVNILTFSYGGCMVNQIGNALFDVMTALDYTPDEIDRITRQVFVATLGSVGIIGSNASNFTSAHFLGMDDREVTVLALSNLKRISPTPIAGEAGKDIVILPPEPGGKPDCIVAFEKTKSEVALGAMALKQTGLTNSVLRTHTTGVYAYAGPAFDPLTPTMLGMALANSLNNSLRNQPMTGPFIPLPDFPDIFMPPERIDYVHNDRSKVRTGAELSLYNIPYTERVAKAVQAGAATPER